MNVASSRIRIFEKILRIHEIASILVEGVEFYVFICRDWFGIFGGFATGCLEISWPSVVSQSNGPPEAVRPS